MLAKFFYFYFGFSFQLKDYKTFEKGKNNRKYQNQLSILCGLQNVSLKKEDIESEFELKKIDEKTKWSNYSVYTLITVEKSQMKNR